MESKIFSDHLKELGVEDGLINLMVVIADASKKVSKAVKSGNLGLAGTENVYGEKQLALDVQSDNIIQEELKGSGLVACMASEELPDDIKCEKGEFSVAYDPLDGSSLVDVNLAVGTIVGIYPGKGFIGRKGDEQVASMIFIYGPRTTLICTARKGVHEYLMDDAGSYYLTKEDLQVAEEGKMFAPGNLRATSQREDYMKLMEYWMREEYKLRYSGGMVPDINQILLKGKGIFTYPGYGDQPNGKLRLLFECAPMALLMEQAGGKATDGKMRILDKEVTELSQRTPIYIGSTKEVEKVEEFLG